MKVGFANGCFDLFHDGHRHLLLEARRHCSYLIVAVNTDEYCRRVKGAGRPIEPLETRMLHVRTLAEAVIPFTGREERLIMEIRPDVCFKGSDHSPDQKAYAQRSPGWKEGSPLWTCPVIHIPRLPGWSTTGLIEQRRQI
jgi:D-beta-D-heptose 7-phosphate kinase / D-beta-D-heptose 1-phosphate adenosyltransferase